ncbi:MBL fold metallo-hydrolase [bacterium 1xD8-48]|jgi:hydroxyacylglutathione hydrolase|nr:MBL fold metallo-hydrolase [Lachnospiraceae bacterium]MCI9327225.1 MBL fold metallo-hydrolase [Lachnospiraceae bacterium]NBJ97668.1 MBL fold metallo-hydrolase [bacterium 1xD8-48]
MKTERIACGMANAYLLHGDGGSILIDTGAEKYREKVAKACQNAGVRLILLTHGHFDHCQSAAYLTRRLKCSIGIAGEDAALLERNEKRKVYGKGIWGRFYADASNRNIEQNEIEAVTPDVILEDGMSLGEYGVDAKTVKLPGHTAGSVGVLCDTGELFVGDAMQNILFPSAAWCYEDYEKAKESAAIVRSMNAGKIFFGHGRVWNPVQGNANMKNSGG